MKNVCKATERQDGPVIGTSNFLITCMKSCMERISLLGLNSCTYSENSFEMVYMSGNVGGLFTATRKIN
jgi:hypothetical protein